MTEARPTTTSLINVEEVRSLSDYEYLMRMYSTVNMAEKLSVVHANRDKINAMSLEDVCLFDQCSYIAMMDTQMAQWMWEAYECLCDIPAARYYYSRVGVSYSDIYSWRY